MTDIALQPAAERYMASLEYEMEHYSLFEFYIASVFVNKCVSTFPIFVLVSIYILFSLLEFAVS